MYVLEPEGCEPNIPKKSPGYDYTLILESGLGLLFMQKGFSRKDISRRVFLRGEVRNKFFGASFLTVRNINSGLCGHNFSEFKSLQ